MEKPHFSSLRLDWKTPKAVYQVLDAEFQFDHDPCPVGGSESGIDGLSTNWGECNYVNPPYGRELPKWVAKAYEQWQEGKTVVMLIPSRTDTRWWHDYCMKATEIRYIKGRLKFDDQPNPAPFPSAIVIFKGDKPMINYNERQDEIFSFHDNCTVNCPHTFAEFDKAKQAITSLIKELVAEAKPKKRPPDYYSDSIDLYPRQCAANSWNKAIDEFEQNLLKALEEV